MNLSPFGKQRFCVLQRSFFSLIKPITKMFVLESTVSERFFIALFYCFCWHRTNPQTCKFSTNKSVDRNLSMKLGPSRRHATQEVRRASRRAVEERRASVMHIECLFWVYRQIFFIFWVFFHQLQIESKLRSFIIAGNCRSF